MGNEDGLYPEEVAQRKLAADHVRKHKSILDPIETPLPTVETDYEEHEENE